jgi:predicted metalloendopeptidase
VSGAVLGKVNGNLTINENIADNGGLKLSYRAYQAYVKAQKARGEVILSTLSTLLSLLSLLSTLTHSPLRSPTHLLPLSSQELPDLLSTVNNDQLYFLAFAQNWCSLQTPDAGKKQLVADEHSPADARVRGTIMNNDDFARAFQCPAGSRMNPRHKCKLW